MDVRALQDSWTLVTKSGDEVPHYFYAHLFVGSPELRDMFPVSMVSQRDKLVGALGHIVSNVDRLEEVTPFIEQLGRDHRRFDVVASHYPAVGASLLATLQHFLGPAWTETLATDWAEAYGILAKVMVASAEQAEAYQPPWWSAEVISVERRTLDITVLQLRPDQRIEYLPGQSFAVEIPSRPRLWRYFSPANAPREDGTIELHVQLIAGGQVSTSVGRTLRAGDQVRIGAPVGDQLTLTNSVEVDDLVLIAGGTGLAPLRAVIEQLDRQWHASGRVPRTHLFHGARWPWNLYEHQLLRQVATQPWFDYTPVVSEDQSFPGSRGLVGSVAARHGLSSGNLALVCGSTPMVEHTVAALTDAGQPADRVRYEQFNTFHVTAAGEGSGDAQ